MRRRLTRADQTKIAEARQRISFYGTPKKNFEDSGLWEFFANVKTKDEHDKVNPVKPVPPKEYLLQALKLMLEHDLVAIPKSRQIMISWAMAIFCAWHARTAPHRRIIWQSKKETDAQAMVSIGSKDPMFGRISFIEHNLPWWLQDKRVTGSSGNQAGMLKYENGSVIIAAPEGGDQVRSNTASLLVADEAAFQGEFESAFVAAKPAIEGGGKMIMVSTAAPSFFERLVHDYEMDQSGAPVPGVVRNSARGMRRWATNGGVEVLEIHYSADPEKDPATAKGEAWFKRAVRGYVGGFASAGWQREMEINWNILGGEPVFPFLANPTSKIWRGRMNPEVAINDLAIYAGFDHGLRNPSACVFVGISKNGTMFILDEIYAAGVDYVEMSKRIKASIWWPHVRMLVADPQIWAKDQSTAHGVKSLAELYADVGIHFTPGRKGVDYPMAQKILATYWKDPDRPRLYICSPCINLKREWQGLKFDEHSSDKVAAKKNQVEKILQKNNHTFDAFAYLLDQRPPPMSGFRAKLKPNTPKAMIQKILDQQAEQALESEYL